MPCCSVLGCTSKTNLFCAPGAKISWDLFVAWVKATGNPKFNNMSKHDRPKFYICQKHFMDEEVALMKMRRKSCIPTLNLPDPLHLQFGIDATSPKSIAIPKPSVSNMVLSQQIQKDPPSTVNDDGIKSLTQPSMAELQQLSGSTTKEVTCVAIPGLSQPSQNVVCSLPFLSNSPKSLGLASMMQPGPSNVFCSPLHGSSPKSIDRSPKLLTLMSSTRRKHLTPEAEAIYLEASRLKKKISKLRRSKASFKKQLREARKSSTDYVTVRTNPADREETILQRHDKIKEFSDLRDNYSKFVKIPENWQTKKINDKLYFYKLDLADGILEINAQIIIDSTLEVKVFHKENQLSFHELKWVLPFDLKLSRWSQLENLLSIGTVFTLITQDNMKMRIQ